MERWQNKVAVVTGASSGIGEACCRHLVANGMIVVGMARRLDRMSNELQASLPHDQQNRFHAVRCDVTKEDEIVKAFAWVEAKLGGIDVLVNNAGIVGDTQLVAANNGADLRAILDTNVLAVAFCTREAFRSMQRRDMAGHVVIVNSIMGHNVPPPILGRSWSMYAPSKYAVTAMTETLRQEFRINQTKIKITSISPGAVNTEILDFPEGFAALHPKDIADAIGYCIQTPPNVQIHEMIVKPLGEQV